MSAPNSLRNRYQTSDGLIGMWGHRYSQDGDIDLQFQVMRRSGDVYLVQIFSWRDGNPCDCIAIKRDALLKLKLYISCEALNAAFYKHQQDRKAPELWQLDNVIPLFETAH